VRLQEEIGERPLPKVHPDQSQDVRSSD
jgi:hypothetical protein